jgi:pentatricopeptide repeat protein
MGRLGPWQRSREVLDLMRTRRCKPDKVTCTTMIKWSLIKGIDGHRVKYLCELKAGRCIDDM